MQLWLFLSAVFFEKASSSMARFNLGLLVVAGLLAGCGESGPTTTQATVSGTVSIDGTPVEMDSAVTFFSENEGANAGGKVDSIGNYNLKAGDPKIGIPVGRYKVTVRPAAASIMTDTMGNVVGADSDQYKKMMGAPAAVARPKAGAKSNTSKIPEEFQNQNTTTIVIESSPGPNKLDFDLGKLSKKK